MFTKEMEAIKEQVKSLLDLIPLISGVEKELRENPTKMDLTADVAFLCKKTEDVMKAVEKRMNQLEFLAFQNGHNMFPHMQEKKYSTNNCTISDNTNFYVKFPTSPSDNSEKGGFTVEQYNDFISKLPPHAVRPHFPTVTELITQELEAGNQIPYGLPAFGIVDVMPKLRVTSKKEL